MNDASHFLPTLSLFVSLSLSLFFSISGFPFLTGKQSKLWFIKYYGFCSMQKGPGQEIAMNYDNTAAQTDRGTVGQTDRLVDRQWGK